MEIIVFFFRLRSKLLVKSLKKGKYQWLIKCGLVALILLYGWLSAVAVYLVQTKGHLRVEPLLQVMYLTAGLLVIGRYFFPIYVPTANFLPTSIPLKTSLKVVLELIIELVSEFYIFLSLYFFTFVSFLDLTYPVKIIVIICLSLMILNAHLISKIARMILEKSFFKAKLVVVFIALAIGLTSACIFLLRLNGLWVCAGLLVNLLFLYFLLVAVTNNGEEKKMASHRSLPPFFIQLVLRNQPFRTALLVALFVKISFAFFCSYAFKDDTLLHHVAIIFFLSPIVIFTYLFNHLWGYYRNVLIAFHLHSSSLGDFLKLYLRLLVPIALLDFTISLPFFVSKPHLFNSLLFYFSLLLILTIVSLYASLYNPRIIKKPMAASNNRILVNLFSFGPVLAFCATIHTNFFQFFVLGFLLPAFLAGLFYPAYFRERMNKIYPSLSTE